MKSRHPIPADWTAELSDVAQTYNTQLDELRRQARHDPLTGLGNRLKLEEDLGRAIRRAQRTKLAGHVLLLDLDQFKTINDQFGHAAGDEVLRIIAQRLLVCVRDTDTVVRLGGDEFVAVITDIADDAGPDAITALIERIRHALSQAIPWQDTFLHVDASIGRAQLGRDGDTIDDLLAQAVANDMDAIRADELEGAEYAALSTKINNEVAYMIENCELEPEADAQLHLVIHDLIDGSTAMSEQTNARDGALTVVGAIQDYATYFDDPDFKSITK